MSHFGWKVPILSQLLKNYDFPVSDGPSSDKKTQFFVQVNLFIVLVMVKCIQAVLHKFPTRTVDSSQLSDWRIFQMQPKVINKKTESWDKMTIRVLEHDCTKQVHDFLSWLLMSQSTFCKLNLSSRSVI